MPSKVSNSKPITSRHTQRAQDDQAMEGRSLRDRLTWNVLRKEATAKTKEKVDEWKDLMQLSLVFVSNSVIRHQTFFVDRLN